MVALLLVLGVCRASHPKPSCRYPPSEWCRSLEIATACKVSESVCLFVRSKNYKEAWAIKNLFFSFFFFMSNEGFIENGL